MLGYSVLLLLFGLVGGFLAGLTGIGGGIIYISVLPFILRKLGVPESEIVPYTVANSIFSTFLGALSANVAFIRRKQFFFREILLMSAASMAASAFATKKIVTQPWYSEKVFNGVVIVLLLVMLTATLLRVNRKTEEQEEQQPEPRIHPLKLLLSGTVAGVVASVSGLGGGVIVIPVLHVLLGMHIKKAAVVSLGVITINSLFISILNFFETPQNPYEGFSLGYVIFPVSLMLGIGVIVASPRGVKAATRLSSKQVTYIFAAILFLVMAKKAFSLFF